MFQSEKFCLRVEVELAFPGGDRGPMTLCIWIRTEIEFEKLGYVYYQLSKYAFDLDNLRKLILFAFYVWDSFYFSLSLFLAIPPGLWGPSSSTRYWTQLHSSESAESYPLDCQGIPMMRFLKDRIEVQPFLIGRVFHNRAFLRCAVHFRLVTECYI